MCVWVCVCAHVWMWHLCVPACVCSIVQTGWLCLLMEKVARPFPEHFQRLRLPIALQVWSFANRYYNKLYNSLLLDSSAEITSVLPLPPFARVTLQCATWASCGTIRWIWLTVEEKSRGLKQESRWKPLGNFYWIWVEHITNLWPPLT